MDATRTHGRRLPRLQVSGGTLVTIALLAVLVYPNLQAQQVADTPGTVLLALGVGVFMIVSVLLHEIGHAVLARAFGARVEHIALTLWGGHTQYTGRNIGPLASALIAVAGPLVNGLIALAAFGAVEAVGGRGALGAFCFYAAVLNVGLAVFNLLPGLPMDGGRAVEGVLGAVLGRPSRGTIVTAWIGRVIAVGVVLLALWRLSQSQGTFGIIVVLWAVIIAGTLWRGASAALQGAGTQERIGRLDLRGLTHPVVLLPTSSTTADVPQATDPRIVLVLDDRGQGWRVDPVALASVPLAARGTTPIGAVTRPVGPVGRVPADLDGEALVDHLLTDRRAEHLVVDGDGRVLGAITTAEVGERLRPGTDPRDPGGRP